jgi:hypothetical protein
MPIRDACLARKQCAMGGVGSSNPPRQIISRASRLDGWTGSSGWWRVASDMPPSLVVLTGKTTANMSAAENQLNM